MTINDLITAALPRVVSELQTVLVPPLEYLTRAVPRAAAAALVLPQCYSETGEPVSAVRKAVALADLLIAELGPSVGRR